MVKDTDKEPSQEQMEQNTLEDGKMVNHTDQELSQGLMEQLKK
jgi:hypothetical protein